MKNKSLAQECLIKKVKQTFLAFLVLMTLLISKDQSVNGRVIRTGSVQLIPPVISEVVDLNLNGNPATTIPADGYIEYIFPEEITQLPLQTTVKENCVLEVPPAVVRVRCTYSFTAENKVRLIADNFDKAIESDSFFTLRIPGFESPRSTASTSSFEFASYDKDDNLLDEQKFGLAAKATEYNEIKTLAFESTSQVVGKQNVFLRVTFRSLEDLLDSDWLKLTIPKWNQEAAFPAPLITYDTNQLQCRGILNAKTSFSCQLQRGSKSDTLTLITPLEFTVPDGQDPAAVDTSTIKAGEEISFEVGPITNPISEAPVSGFELQTLSARMGYIATGIGALTVSEPAVVAADAKTVTLTASETLINKVSNFQLEIELPLPLNAGCQIEVYVPKPLFIGSDLSKVVLSGMFGQFRDAPITLDADQNLIKVDDACQTYRPNISPATLDIRSFMNPGYVITSDSFYVKIRDIDGNEVVHTSGGMVYTTTPGTMNVGDWYASNRLVSALSEITFSVQPLNPTATKDVQIKLTLPAEDFELMPDPCEMEYYNQLVDSGSTVCQTNAAENMLILSQVLNERYSYEELTRIEFSINDIKMPSSSRPTGQYQIDFLQSVDGTYRLVDTVKVTDKIRAVPGSLYEIDVEPLKGTTFTEDTMTFELQVGHIILQNGYLTVRLPPELTFVNTPACLSFSAGIDPDATCVFDEIEVDGTMLGMFALRGAFKSGPYDQLETKLEIQVSSIFTPRSAMPTSTFQIETFDEDGWAIDTHGTYFLPAPRVAKAIEDVRVLQSETEVGKETVYDILLKSPYPLYAGDLLNLDVPDQAAANLAQTFRQCIGSPAQTFLREEARVMLVGLNGITLTLDLADGLSEIPIGAEFGFQISFLKNPESTRPSDPFRVRITDDSESLIVGLTEEAASLERFVMHATTPARLFFQQINNDPKQALEPTLIFLQLATTHALPKDSKLKIAAPRQLGLPPAADGSGAADTDQLACWIDSSPFGDVECTFDEGTYTFTLEKINPHGALRGGTSLQIELKGLRNRRIAEVTDSFTALTLTQDGYLIDEVTSGMTVASNCDWPCWECPFGEPQQCLTCDTRPGALLPLFFEGTCRNDCPSGYYEIDGVCAACDASCQRCEQTSDQCLECHPGAYLLGNSCMDKCPSTHHGVDATKTCELCEAPCKTCDGSLTRCTSCDQALPNTKTFLFRNECWETCPADISVEDEGQCVACNPNCATCDDQYSADFCTSCRGGAYLDYFTHSCVDVCPAGLTVANEAAVNPKNQLRTCDLCNERCATCSSYDPDICLECRAGLKMLETARVCLDRCPLGTAEIWVPLTGDTVCAECAPGCTECEYSRQHCTACAADFVRHDFSCIKECPTDYMPASPTDRTCVREREACPFGQREVSTLNEAGETVYSCELYLAECKVGYVLNADETECIPEPGFHLPFAFLYGALGWTLFILRRKNRERFPRVNLVSQLLLGFTALQQLSYIVQIFLAFTLDFHVVSGLHTFAMFMHYIVNAVCLLIIHWLPLKDKPFDHWRDQYTRENRIIATVSTLYSFKATRFLYSNFAGRPYFDAACEDRFRALVRPFFIITMASLLQTAAVVLANVQTIWLLRWGYEIVTLAISSMIMAIVIFALEVYEFVLYKRDEPAHLRVGDYFAKQTDPAERKLAAKGRANKRMGQVRVMSVMDGDGPDNDVGIPQSEDSLQDMASGVNLSQKNLLGKGRQSLSDQKMAAAAAKDESGPFQFENFQMGKRVRVDRERIDFGEQGQARTLQSMIKKLSEHEKIKRIQKDLDAQIAKDEAAFDGKDIPHSSEEDENESPAGKPAVVDQYLDEEIRKKLLVSSTKHKTREFRQKRQQFEKHRRDQRDSQAEVEAKGQRGYHSDFEDRHKTDRSGVNPYKSNQKRPLRPMITTVKLGQKEPGAPGYLEKLQEASDGELERDKLMYDQFYVKYKKEFDEKARNGQLVPNAKLHQSFDEDVLREMYDDFGVCSDFDSELSWISYPPDKGFLCDYYENNPVKQAENELFKQKIKIKFQFNNMYKESYDVPPRAKLNLKPAVKTQTLASDIAPEQIAVSSGGERVRTIDLNFDPFESEEEFVPEESEKLSAIDESVYRNVVDKVIFEGFSDLDSDVAIAQEASRMSLGASIASQLDQKDQSREEKQTKKRKRDDTQTDFVVGQILAKQEAQASRVGLNGRATDLLAARALEEKGGQLGDVYDTMGHLVYDKDYISQGGGAGDDGLSSVREGSQRSGRSKGSKRSRSKRSQSPPSHHSRASKAASRASHAPSEVDVKSKSSREGKSLGREVPSSRRSARAGTHIDFSDAQLQQRKGQEASQLTASSRELLYPDQIVSHNNFFAMTPGANLHPAAPNFNTFFDDYEEAESENRADKHLSKRERQMIKAYTSNPTRPIDEVNAPASAGPTQESPHSRKRSKANSTRKRKRIPSGHSPDAAGQRRGPLSNRGLSDAQSQIEQDAKQPDAGILQLVISQPERSAESANAEANQQMTISQLKPEKRTVGGPGDASELDGNIDQETRGGNLSSSAHDHSSHANLHGGYQTASMNMHGSAAMGAPENASRRTFTQGQQSAVKAHHFLNNPQWESDASNSQMYQHFSGLHTRKTADPLRSPHEDGALRTDDEQNMRRRNYNQTEIQNVDGMYEQDGANVDHQTHQIQNWSDDGANQQRMHQYDRQDDDEYPGHGEMGNEAFNRLGGSYRPLNRKMTGPQPFQSLGVTSKPYKARRKRQNEQLLADQRRAKFSMGSDRMVKLESIYIKNGLTQNAQGNRNTGLPPRMNSIPRADALATETVAAFKRHGKRADSGVYKLGPHTTSKVNRRQQGPRLHKQNFVEDGANIIAGQLYKPGNGRDPMTMSSERQLPQVKRELQGLQHSASEIHTDVYPHQQLETVDHQHQRQQIGQSLQGRELIPQSPQFRSSDPHTYY